MGIYEELQARGLIAQVTDEERIKELVNNGKATFYIGFDPTADSLHVGHFMALCLMKRLQEAGNKPIALIGGGTGYIGDPSGRTDMRSMMTPEQIQHNCDCFKEQMSRFIDFSDGKALMVNNADWLMNLNYVEVLRDVGPHFSVNRMLSHECYKQRMERGLTFLEFNYMIMQSYDFYMLYQKYGCNMQFGGDDQWSNMLGGTELIRRKLGKDAYAMTITLLTDSQGKKMGKTAGNAVWLDPNKTSDTIARSLLNCGTVYAQSPVALLKAVKNDVQIEGTRKAMERDGVALVKLFMWIEQNVTSGSITEYDVAQKVQEFRAASPLYRGESFGLIAGYNEHGAIVHYEPEKETSSTLNPEGMLLVDTGGQYLDGTTDITRTVALGTPTEAQRHDYTLVLKGHIALGSMIYPTGTRGSQLDVLARQFLWKECMTYWHGTGHGVGHFLNVHEGPQNFRLNENPTVLVPGMITSDEPGLYKTGEYGIRIENLVLSRNYRHTDDFGDFMNFEVLTLFPYDSRLIDLSMLSADELAWVNNYHATVRERLMPHLDAEQKAWLEEKTKELKK